MQFDARVKVGQSENPELQKQTQRQPRKNKTTKKRDEVIKEAWDALDAKKISTAEFLDKVAYFEPEDSSDLGNYKSKVD